MSNNQADKIVEIVGGMRWKNVLGGVGSASWPLVRLTITSEKCVLGGSEKFFKLFVPSFQYDIKDISKVEDAWVGIRIINKKGEIVYFLTWPYLSHNAQIISIFHDLGVSTSKGPKVPWIGM